MLTAQVIRPMAATTCRTIRGTGFGRACLVAVILVAGGAAGAMTEHDRERLVWDNALPRPLPMPETTFWARPYARGPLRILFVADYTAYGPYQSNSGRSRPGVELRQRFDFDGRAIVIPIERVRKDVPGFEEYAVEAVEAEYDCCIATHLGLLDALPDRARESVLRKTRNGAGLVVARFDPRRPGILEGVSLTTAPAFLAGTGARTGVLEKGRVAVGFPQLPPDPFPQGQWEKKLPPPAQAAAHAFEAYYTADMYYEKLGRIVIWAAGREPRHRLAIEVKPGPVSWQNVDQAVVNVASPSGTAANVRLRSGWTGTLRLEPAGSEPGRYALPPLPAGRYFLDGTVSGERGVTAWTATQFTVTATDRIRGIKLDRDWGEVGAILQGSVELQLAGSEAERVEPAPDTLRIQVLDKHGRELARTDHAVAADTIAFPLRVEPFFPALTYLRAVLQAGERPVTSAMTWFRVPHRSLDTWQFTMWGVIGGRHGGAAGPAANRLWLEETLARYGVTARVATGAPWPYMTSAGMTYAAFTGGAGIPGKGQVQVADDGTLKGFRLGSRDTEELGVGCMNDEPAVSRRLRETMRADDAYTPVEVWRRAGVLAYLCPDEAKTRGACLDPACWQTYRDWLRRRYGGIEALNASWGYAYKSFDEIQPTVDRSAVLNAKERYGDIAALNAAWGTTYDSFEEIPPSIDWTAVNNEYASVPAPPSQWAGDQYAVKEGGYFGVRKISYPRYFDRIAFQYWNIANHARRWRRIARELDPEAKMGFSAPMSCLDDDLDTLARGTDAMIVYSHLQMDVLRALRRPGYLFGTWAGYAEDEWNRNAFWQSFLRGATNNGWWYVHHFLGPHLEPGSRARFVHDARPVFDGLGTLLNLRSRRCHDGIAMLASFPSAQAAKFEAGYSYGTWDPFNSMGHYDEGSLPGKGMDWGLKPGGVNHFVWHRAIRALGLQFEYVTEKMIQRGEFRAGEFRVMVLSQCEALGPETAAAIRAFVAGGGVVIADVRPGLYDGHCKPQPGWNGVLDTLFGVRHNGNVPAAAAPGRIEIPDLDVFGARAGGREPLALDLPELQVNPALEVTTARAMGQAGSTPILTVHSFGRGRAILFNFPLCTYPNLSLPDTPPQAAELLAAILAGARIQWPFVMETADGRPHRNLTAVRWQTGKDTEIVALYGPLNTNRSTLRSRDDGTLSRIEPWTGRDDSVNVRLQLREKRCVTVLGTPGTPRPVEEFVVQLGLWRPTFLVLSSRPLREPEIELSQTSEAADMNLCLRANVPDRQVPRLLTLRFLAPDGTSAPWFDRNVMVTEGGSTEWFRLAHNEQPGRWRVTATDLVTGLATSAAFRIE